MEIQPHLNTWSYEDIVDDNGVDGDDDFGDNYDVDDDDAKLEPDGAAV